VLEQSPSGLWTLTVSTGDPKDKKWEGRYRPYFNACNRSIFVGFYKEDYDGTRCTNDQHTDLRGKKFCAEAWLPESILTKKTDIVVLYGGADLASDGDVGSAGSIVREVTSQHDSNLDIKAFVSDFWGVGIIDPNDVTRLSVATEECYRFIKTKLNKELESVIIYGYSWGGVLAQHLTKRLKEDHITVKLLITIDAAAGYKSDIVSRVIGNNVEENLNIYQTEPSSILSRGYPNTAENSEKTLVDNFDYSNTYAGTPGEPDFVETTHSSIDEISLPRVTKKIIETLN